MNSQESRAFYRTFKRRFYRKYPYLQGKPLTYDTFFEMKEHFKEHNIMLPKHGAQRYDEPYRVMDAFLEVALYTKLDDWDSDMIFYSLCGFIFTEQKEDRAKHFTRLLFDLDEYRKEEQDMSFYGAYFFEYWMQWEFRHGRNNDYVFKQSFTQKALTYVRAWWPAPVCLMSPAPYVSLLLHDDPNEHFSGFLDRTYQKSGKIPRHDFLKSTSNDLYNMYLCKESDLFYWLVDAALPKERIDNLNYMIHHFKYLPDDFITRYEKDITIEAFLLAKEDNMPWTLVFGPEYDFAFSMLEKSHTLYDVRQFNSSYTYPQKNGDEPEIVYEDSLFL